MSIRKYTLVLFLGAVLAAGCGSDTDGEQQNPNRQDAGVEDDSGAQADSGPEPDPGEYYGDEFGPGEDEPDDFEHDVIAMSCDGGPDSNCLEPADNTIVLDKERHYGIISARPMQSHVELTVRDDSPLKQELERGTHIVRRRPGRRPLMHRVAGIRWQGNTAQVQTERAQLNEVYKRGRIRTSFTASESLQQFRQFDEYRTARQAVGLEDCTGTLIDSQLGPNVDLHAELTQCQFTFDPRISVDAKWLGPNAHVEIIATGDFKALAEVKFRAQAAMSDEAEMRLGTQLTIPLTFMPALAITVDVYGGYEYAGNATLDVKAGFDYESTVSVGFLWEGARPFHITPVWNYTDNFEPIGPYVNFDGELDASVYIHPRIGLSVLGTLNGNVGMKASAKLGMNADLTSQPTANGEQNVTGMVCYDLQAALQFTVGGELNPLGLLGNPPSLEYDSGEIPFTLVPEGTCADFEQVMETSCTESDECIVDSDCVADLRPACSLPVCGTNCSCTFVEIPGCCTQDSECDDGNVNTDDFCNDSFTCSHVTETCNADADCDNGGDDLVGECVKPFPGDKALGTCSYHRSFERTGDTNFLTPPECNRATDCADGEICLNSVCHPGTEYTDPCDGVICDDNNALTEDTCENGTCVFDNKRLLSR